MILKSLAEKADVMPIANAYLNSRYSEVSVSGLQHLPEAGAGLIVSNHEHIDDSFLYYRLIMQETGRMPRFAVTKDVFGWPGVHGTLMREFLLAHRQIPVDRFSPRSALDLRAAMGEELRRGELGLIFPEKTTPKTGYVHRFHTVAAQIAIDQAVAVTPMHISYTKAPHSIRRSVDIRISAPLTPSDASGMDRHELSLVLQRRVGELGGQALSSEWGEDPSGYTSEWHADRFVAAE